LSYLLHIASLILEAFKRFVVYKQLSFLGESDQDVNINNKIFYCTQYPALALYNAHSLLICSLITKLFINTYPLTFRWEFEIVFNSFFFCIYNKFTFNAKFNLKYFFFQNKLIKNSETSPWLNLYITSYYLFNWMHVKNVSS
jgi:hypothetical protein